MPDFSTGEEVRDAFCSTFNYTQQAIPGLEDVSFSYGVPEGGFAHIREVNIRGLVLEQGCKSLCQRMVLQQKHTAFRLYDFSFLCRPPGAPAAAASAAPPQSSHASFRSSREGPPSGWDTCDS